MNKPNNCIIVIFGASGDLTKRKLMPSLYELYDKNLMPDAFAIVGIGRTEYDDDSFRVKMDKDIRTFTKSKKVDDHNLKKFLSRIHYLRMDPGKENEYRQFSQKLNALSMTIGGPANIIYYMSTTPRLYRDITSHLGSYELNREESGWKRIVFEKPFGYDLQSARSLNNHIQNYFKENQVYRIDHYLGKETVQNILAFRFANGIFEPLWNRNYIHHVEITAAENLGVENRGKYYDGSGALRDMIQNHLLQVLATIAMEPPAKFNDKSIRDEKVKVFQSLCPLLPESIPDQVVRGQYVASVINEEPLKAYRLENDVPEHSMTETYAAIKLFIDNWRWGGIPFFIRTGKRLPIRITEVAIHFNKTPHHLFTQEFQSIANDNLLIIRIQPNEGLLLRFGMKTPGAGFQIQSVDMDFHYKDLINIELPDAYERLLLDCMQGDATLYARSDAVEACWHFITPILDAWQNNPSIKLYGYPAGSWGPKEASLLFSGTGKDWRYPVESLTDNSKLIEL